MTISNSASATPGESPIVISLFGTFDVTVKGRVIDTFHSNKARALLAYLLMTHDQPSLRTELAELLWQDYAEASARTNLRKALASVREVLAPFNLLQADRHFVQLRVGSGLVTCDALQFIEYLDACRRHKHEAPARCPSCQSRLHQALALYRGAFLDNFPLIDSPRFTKWLHTQRNHFAACAAEAEAMLAPPQPVVGNLPPALTPLVGRTGELTALTAYLHHETYRCVTIVGAGGMGKTRLARALGAQEQARQPDGVWLVDLGALHPPTAGEAVDEIHERIATAIGVTLGFAFQGAAPPTAQVAAYLAHKTALLILDSFEHFSAGAAWLPMLLEAAPTLRLLLTSRHRPPLQSQLVYPLQGLAVPPLEQTGAVPLSQAITHYAGVQLFIERATSAGIALALDASTLTTVGELCRLVEGSPWAIELAVSMLTAQSPAAILAAIRANYGALVTDLLDVPLRQRSAEAVLQAAWRLLTPREALVLARCAVFHGGFTQAAGLTIADAALAELQALVHKSLLHPAGDRFILHELVRQFAGEQLAQSPQAQSVLLARHAAYYIELLQEEETELPNTVNALKKLQNDLDNIRAAWRWSTDQGQLALLEKGVGSLQDYYRLAGIYAEALQLLAAALPPVRQAVALSSPPTGAPRLLARLLCYMAQFYRLYRRADEVKKGENCAQEALALGRHLADPALQALAYHELARLADAQSDYAAMGSLAAQGCTQARQANLPHLTAECLNDLGIAVGNCTEPLAGIPHFQEALACLRQQPNRVLAVRITGNLAGFYLSGHAYQAAYQHFQQVRDLRRLLQHRENSLLTQITYGDLWMALGAYAAAQQEYAQGFALVQAGRASYWESWLQASYGRLQHLCGDPAAAQSTCRLARQIAQEDGQRFVEQWALINLGHALADLGELAAAAQCYRQAIAAHQAGNWLFRLPDAQAGLAAVLLAQNEAPAALTHVETALALLAQQGLAAAGEPFLVYGTCVRVLAAAGDPRAHAVLATAYQALQERATQLTDAELRHSLRQSVAANRKLIAAAHAAGIVPQTHQPETQLYPSPDIIPI
ncbi:MAG: hypothetical protein R3E79_39660 [Caldilineaceae bacterium]